VLNGIETYTGSTTVNQGTLTLNGNGTLLASSAYTVNPGAALTLDNNTGGNNANRLNDVSPATTLTLAGGTLNFIGASNAVSKEVLGNLQLNAGNSFINNIATGTGSALVNFVGTITRAAGAIVSF